MRWDRWSPLPSLLAGLRLVKGTTLATTLGPTPGSSHPWRVRTAREPAPRMIGARNTNVILLAVIPPISSAVLPQQTSREDNYPAGTNSGALETASGQEETIIMSARQCLVTICAVHLATCLQEQGNARGVATKIHRMRMKCIIINVLLTR